MIKKIAVRPKQFVNNDCRFKMIESGVIIKLKWKWIIRKLDKIENLFSLRGGQTIITN